MTYLKDYTFENGNRYDFRRANIKIINHYIGVLADTKYHKPTFVSKIFTDKYIVVGHYVTEIQAAITYKQSY